MVRVTLDNDTSVVSTHSRPEAAGASPGDIIARGQVSTHSRPEAAGMMASGALGETGTFQLTAARRRLGLGWWRLIRSNEFQLTAARRRLGRLYSEMQYVHKFQLTAARRRLGSSSRAVFFLLQFQLTAARRRLGQSPSRSFVPVWFQLTAARRRLAHSARPFWSRRNVSTHSRPEAAGPVDGIYGFVFSSFNSQPPGGGWTQPATANPSFRKFQLTAARRRLEELWGSAVTSLRFNSQPPGGGWAGQTRLVGSVR